jgi:hypothetical protein
MIAVRFSPHFAFKKSRKIFATLRDEITFELGDSTENRKNSSTKRSIGVDGFCDRNKTTFIFSIHPAPKEGELRIEHSG